MSSYSSFSTILLIHPSSIITIIIIIIKLYLPAGGLVEPFAFQEAPVG
jgi:hypothetical protein